MYGGTKSEMARLVKESGVLGKAGEDLTVKNFDQKVSFDKIVEAIHAVQENMGITGTTAKEASSTIQGSVASMKSAWQNLLTGIADGNQDLSKLLNDFVQSAITAGKNITPRIKEIIESFKKLGKAIVNEVFPKIKREIPELKPLIETFEWFIKNKDKVINAVKLMIGAFAVAKIAQFTKSLSDGVKAVLELAKNTALATTATTANTTAQVANTTAQVAGTTATKGLTVATNLLNNAWKANPVGVVIAGVTALIAVMKLLDKENEKARKAEEEKLQQIKEQTEEIIRNKSALEERTQAQNDSINSGLSELSYYEKLYKELTTITDENGKVKEGYEQRASFIATTLKDALGLEIEYNNGVVSGYKELEKSIQDVINKKKAEIILEAQKEDYAQAVANEGKAYRDLTETQDKYKQKTQELESAEAELNQQLKDNEITLDRITKVGGLNDYLTKAKQISATNARIRSLKEETSELETQMQAQTDIAKTYTYQIGVYENNMALAHEGNYDKMITADYNYVKKYEDLENAKKAQIEDEIRTTEEKLNTLQGMRNDSNKDIIDGQIETAKLQLENLKKDLQQYQKTTEEGLNKVEDEWDDSLDDQLSFLTKSKVEFKDAGNDQVQAYVDGVKVGEPKSKTEMAKLATESLQQLKNQQGEAVTIGENYAEGVGNGVDNKSGSIFSKIHNFGKNLLANLKASLQEQSPSKATKKMGQYLIEGLGLGIESEERNVLNSISSFGKSVLSTFNSSLGNNGLGIDLSGQIQTGMPSNINSTSAIQTAESQSFNYDTMLVAFQDALASMKVELDDEEAGRFVRKTVENAIYT